MQAIARRIGHAVAAALGETGVDACHRGIHDLEVQGRKIAAAGGVLEGDALLYQGVIYADLDFAILLRAIRTPAQGLGERALAATLARVTDLKAAFGESIDAAIVKEHLIAAFESEFSAELHDADLSLTEHARYNVALAEIDTPDWIDLVTAPAADIVASSATQIMSGGSMNVSIRYDRARHRIRDAWFTSDNNLLLTPEITRLEAMLHETSVERLERNVDRFFSCSRSQTIARAEVISLLRRGLQLPLVVPHP
jgi:lipoate-protein ligase A